MFDKTNEDLHLVQSPCYFHRENFAIGKNAYRSYYHIVSFSLHVLHTCHAKHKHLGVLDHHRKIRDMIHSVRNIMEHRLNAATFA